MIVIDGIQYSIVIKTPDFPEGEGRTLGYVDYDTCIITLRQGMSRGRTESTLFHELLHPMILNEARLMEHDKEEIVSRLAEKLYATLQTNGLLREGWFDLIVDEYQKDKNESGRVEIDYGNKSDTAKYESVRRDRNEGEILS